MRGFGKWIRQRCSRRQELIVTGRSVLKTPRSPRTEASSLTSARGDQSVAGQRNGVAGNGAGPGRGQGSGSAANRSSVGGAAAEETATGGQRSTGGGRAGESSTASVGSQRGRPE